MKTLYVSRAWNCQPVLWDRARTTAFAGTDAKLTGHRFDEIVLCMAEIEPWLRHDYTLQDALRDARLRLKHHGRIVLDHAAPADFFRRREASNV